MIKTLFKCLKKKQIKVDKCAFAIEFAQTVEHIKSVNKTKIINVRLVPFLSDFAIATEGYMPDRERVLELAEAMFQRAKLEGVLDELNVIKEAV